MAHEPTGFRLHSHEVRYGSGSGQQSVTSVSSGADPNSYFLIKAEFGGFKKRGTPVECGDIIRLSHSPTKMFLHSHLHKAPLSGNQEVRLASFEASFPYARLRL